MKLSTFASLIVLLASTAWAGKLKVVVSETGGLDRASYPVHGQIQLPGKFQANTRFRLTHKGKVVVAQFRPKLSRNQSTNQWWLDFVAYLKPLEKRIYEVEYGPDVKPSPERRGGHQLTTKPKSFVVSNAPYIDWTVPRDLRGLLKSVNFRPSEHLRPNSRGLMIRDRTGKIHRLGGPNTRAQVIRHGRMAVALRFHGKETRPELAGVRWLVDLIFPGPVSWVEVRTHIDDPQKKTAEIGLELKLNLDPPQGGKPTLVELGASSVVYTYLTGRLGFEMRANANPGKPSWVVLRGPPRALQRFAVPLPSRPQPAEGWAHVMDRKRSLGLAVHQFGEHGPERMRFQADGTFTAWRSLTANKGRRKPPWRMWLHFLHFPHHASARASPQQMQHPIRFEQQ